MAAALRLSVWHFWVANAGALLMVVGIAGINDGREQFKPMTTVGAILAILGSLAFCDDSVPWHSAQDGMVYYRQKATAILRTSTWIVILERVLSLLLFIVLFFFRGSRRSWLARGGTGSWSSGYAPVCLFCSPSRSDRHF